MNMNDLLPLRFVVPTRQSNTNLGLHSSQRVGTTRLVLIALIALLFCSFAHAENQINISQEHFNNLGVTLGKLEVVSQIPLLTAPAKVVVPPAQEFVVSASQAGLITKLNAAIGDNVKKGAVLAELNSSDLLSMQRLYLKALSELQLSAVFYQRDKKLLQEGVIADRRWQETQAQHEALLSEANEHKQLLQIAGMTDGEIAQLGKTRRLSSQLSLHAPITGVIMERMAVAGERIDSLAPIYRVANLDELWLEINIPQERVAGLKIGDQVQIENTDITAKINLLGQNVNAESQTVLARAVINSKQSTVRAGQRINIQITQASDLPIFKVPNAAIAQNEGKSFIFVRDKAGFVVTPISVIGKQGEESIISGELFANQDIAIQGAVALKANWLGLGSAE
ncbi:MAG: efflux RND transporter periplasmic adaptor subunit [Methylococcales bacterium]|nr:efflux RND transporter periplasmic adaptor subunit [Methylococcales bacterium]